MNWTRVDTSAARRIPPAFRPLPNPYGLRYTQPSDEQPASSGIYLAQLFDTLRRYRRFILAVAACGTLLAAVAALLIAPKYTAIAQVVVEPAQNSAAALSAPTANDSIIDTQVKMLTANDHLQQVLDSLLADPEFIAARKRPAIAAKPDEKPATPTAEASGISELNRRLHIWMGAIFRNRHGAILDMEDLERYLKVGQEGRSRVVTVRYTSPSPTEAAIVANRVVQLYVDRQNEPRLKYTSRELIQLRERVAQARDEMMRSTAAAQAAAQNTQTAQKPNGDGTATTQLRDLERDAAARALIYSQLQRREKEMLSQRDSGDSNVRVLALATPPEQPSSHNPVLFILPALIIFLIGGCFVAVIAEQSDRGLRSESDIDDALGVPCIGLVPRLPRNGNMRPHQYMLTSPFSTYTETIRSAVGELWLTPQRSPTTVLISSSVPGEGKTTAAISISVCAAMLGRRVLLIDLDFKKPSVANELASQADKNIFDILLRNRSPHEVITRIPELGIDYLPMSACTVDALPILAGEQMPHLLRQLSANYDSVIIDGPPLLVVAEARFLARMVDRVLFVVKWGSTRREVAQNGMNLLRSLDDPTDKSVTTPIVLLTQVDLKQHATYRYGDVGEALASYENYYSPSVHTKSE
jgi:uncharacterized protein involved in exopolysaccharide biosynthesis/Mrp family chromosome partitioning ATPase